MDAGFLSVIVQRAIICARSAEETTATELHRQSFPEIAGAVAATLITLALKDVHPHDIKAELHDWEQAIK